MRNALSSTKRCRASRLAVGQILSGRTWAMKRKECTLFLPMPGDTLVGADFLRSFDQQGTRWKTGFEEVYRKGDVLSCSIKGTAVSGRVRGSQGQAKKSGLAQPRIYAPKITFCAVNERSRINILEYVNGLDSFPEIDLTRLYTTLKGDTTRKLNPVFPFPSDTESVMEASCQCDDFVHGGTPYWHGSIRAGQPCKHLAALIFELAANMDRDPTVAFEVKGIDLWAPPPVVVDLT